MLPYNYKWQVPRYQTGGVRDRSLVMPRDNTRVDVGTAEAPRYKAPFTPDYFIGEQEYKSGNYVTPNARAYAQKISGRVDPISPEFDLLGGLGLSFFKNNIGTAMNKLVSKTSNAINLAKTPKVSLQTVQSQGVSPNFLGDHLDLMKQRLQNGGFEKLGIPNNDIAAPVQNIINKYGGGSYDDAVKNSFSFDYKIPQNRRDYLINSQPQRLESYAETVDAFYNPNFMYYTGPSKLGVDKIGARSSEKLNRSVSAHEFQHMVDDVATKVEINKYADFDAAQLYDQLNTATNKFSYVNAPGLKPIKDKELKKYFSGSNGTELNARGQQIKNYFGITDPNKEITEEMWNYAKRNYVKDTGLDNRMTDFFNSVENVPEFLKWLNPRIAVTTGIVGGSALMNK